MSSRLMPGSMRRLILHFDVNETILVGDPAGGDTFAESLNKIICKNAHVRIKGDKFQESEHATEEPTWHDGSALSAERPPPLHTGWHWPINAMPAYRHGFFKSRKKSFTESGSPGQHYRHLYEAMEQALRWPPELPADPRLCHDGLHHFLLPAFFHTISELAAREREFTIVIRTFGTDIDDVARAMTAYSEGKHVVGRGVSAVAIDDASTWNGKYSGDGFTLTRSGKEPEAIVDEALLVAMLEAKDRGPIAAVACTDDYQWWSEHGYAPQAGKPLWLTQEDVTCHHIFFDDNIHNLANDSIVAVRQRSGENDSFVPLSGEDTLSQHGRHIVRVPTIEPILNVDWFLEQIDACEASLRVLQ